MTGDALSGVRRDSVASEAPAVAVAHRVGSPGWLRVASRTDRGVVTAADDQIPDGHALSPRDTDGGCARLDGVVVDAAAERIGH